MQAQEDFIMIKGKRTNRPRRPASPFALTLASSSSTTAEHMSSGCSSNFRVTPSPSNSGVLTHEDEEDMANCLILLAKGIGQKSSASSEVYQCKTCNKSFPSFQALGGHRASHKKPNYKATATTLEDKKIASKPKQEEFRSNCEDGTNFSLIQMSPNKVLGNISPPNKSRVHECSICGAEFGSGQALGGHMRRHRPIPQSSSYGESQETKRARNILAVDLNLPAPEDDNPAGSKFPFATNEQVIVFSASPLVDCHY